jgi:outer membrane protein OmpA-like peptidoglycan-associated protein
MKKQFYLAISIFAVIFVTAFAGVPKAARSKIAKGDELFAQEDYDGALKPYLEAFKSDPSNANLCFKIGVCCLNIPSQKHNAENYLFVASNDISDSYRETSIKERHAPVIALYYFGQALHFNQKFDDAITAFENYKTHIAPADKKAMEDVELRILWCNNGKALVANPVNIKVENVGAGINSKYPEYSPVISADEQTLIFTTRRPTNTGGQIDPRDGMYFEDIYVCNRTDSGWGKAVPIGDNINTASHDASIGLSADGQQLLIYKDDAGDGNIYSSNIRGNDWTAPQKFNENINSKSWEPSACITPDGKILYFTSNRPGGYGGRDIYRSLRLPNGEWAKPVNLGPKINTAYDEDAPVILADGITLYFASNGKKSMGGFDILYSVLSPDSGWGEPQNIGYPVNTTDDDVYFAPTPDNKHGYYSSANNPNGMGEKDIYYLTFPEKEESKVTILEGEITSIFGGVPANTIITVTDVESGEMVGTYLPNAKTGRYVIVLPPGKNYSISYEADNFAYQSDNINVVDSMTFQEIERPVELSPLKVGQKIVVRNIFFTTGKAALQPDSKTELDKIVDLMTKYPNLILEISGHTDASGPDDLNMKLSLERAIVVQDYLVAHGIDKSRLRTKGFGESQPIAINYNKDGSPNKQGMAMNRRFEFKVLSVDGNYKDVVAPIDVPDNLKNKQK